jgi:flagellar protein FliL
MAEKDEKKGTPDGAATPPPKSKKKLVIFGLVGLIAVVLIGGGIFFYFNKGKSAPKDNNAAVAAQTPKEEEKKAEGDKKKEGEKGKTGSNLLVTLEPFILNLADVDTNRYLKITIVLEFGDAAGASLAEGRMPQIRDALILLMSSLTYGDIHSVEGKLTLQSEILNRLNKVMEGASIRRIYFTDLVVQ